MRAERNLLNAGLTVVESTVEKPVLQPAGTKSETETRRNSKMQSSRNCVVAALRVAARLRAARTVSPLERLLLLKFLEKYTMTALVECWHLVAMYWW